MATGRMQSRRPVRGLTRSQYRVLRAMRSYRQEPGWPAQPTTLMLARVAGCSLFVATLAVTTIRALGLDPADNLADAEGSVA